MTLCKNDYSLPPLVHALLLYSFFFFSFFPPYSLLSYSHYIVQLLGPPPAHGCHGSSLYLLTCCFLMAMGGRIGLEEQEVPVVSIHGDGRVPGRLGAVGAAMPEGQAPTPRDSLVGAWYLTCRSSSSISWGAGLNGELKTPGH